MIHNMYSVYDIVARKYQMPEIATNDAVAQRAFTEWAKGVPYKNDYQLWYIGEWCDETGELETPEQGHKLIIKGESIAIQV